MDKINIDVTNYFNMTPIFYALKNGHLNIVEFMIANKANLNIITTFTTKLEDYLPKGEDHESIMKRLIRFGYVKKDQDPGIDDY